MQRFVIVIPTYNSASTLPEAVASALGQTFLDYSVVVSDNASTDDSVEYLSKLTFPRLRVVLNRDSLGKTDNWNRAFDHAPTAEFFVMLHSDDVLAPNALANLDMAIRKYPDRGLYFGNHERLATDGSKGCAKSMWPVNWTASGREFLRLQVFCNAVSVVAVTFPQHLFKEIGGFSPAYDHFQDMELFAELANRHGAVYVSRRLGFYRDVPLRPKAILQFSIEQQRWISSRGKALPAAVRTWVLDYYFSDACRRLMVAGPEWKAAFVTAMAAEFAPRQPARRNFAFGPTRVHLVLKALLTLRSVFSIKFHARHFT